MTRGIRQLSLVVATDVTDDLGAFRLHSLPAGDYYVGATLRAAPPEEPGLLVGVSAPIYFPGTPSTNEAIRVGLTPGQERSDVSFTVTPVRTVRVSGVLMSAAGSPATDVAVELLNATDYSVVTRSYGNFGMSQEGGRFTFLNVAPGAYVASARIQRGTAPPEVALAPITVGGDDVAGITVAARKGTVLTGTVTAVQGAALPPGVRLSVMAGSIRDNEPQTGAIDRQGAFSIGGLVGLHHIGVEGLPEGWMVESVEISGQPVTDQLVDFGGVERTLARIVVTNQSSVLSGTLRHASGGSLDASVVVFPSNQTLWPYPSRFVRAVRADSQGRYRISGLPSDEKYLAVALEQLEEGDVRDPELLERLAAVATPFALAPGERKTVDLTVVGP
jgi:hypothetical protein